jgi:hypothetical protein
MYISPPALASTFIRDMFNFLTTTSADYINNVFGLGPSKVSKGSGASRLLPVAGSEVWGEVWVT